MRALFYKTYQRLSNTYIGVNTDHYIQLFRSQVTHTQTDTKTHTQATTHHHVTHKPHVKVVNLLPVCPSTGHGQWSVGKAHATHCYCASMPVGYITDVIGLSQEGHRGVFMCPPSSHANPSHARAQRETAQRNTT